MRVQTPRRCGLPLSAGVLFLATLSCRPLRTSCWIVGTASPSSVRCCICCAVSVLLGLFRSAAGRPGEAGQRPTSLAQTVVCLPDPRARACRRFHDAPGPRKNGPDDGEEGRTRPARRSAAAAACQGIFPGPPAWRPDLGSQTRVPAVTGTDNQNTYA